MKKSKIPRLFLVGLLVLLATTALATQVRMVTFSSGSGRVEGGSHGSTFTLGQPISGRADEVAGNYMAVLGIWEILSQTQIVSPVGDETPVVRNHLFRNYPNPFNPSTRISFSLEQETKVRLEVYDLKGRRVDTILNGVKPAGAHSITYEPKNLASGVYLVLMRAGSFRASQRMMLVK